MIQENIFSGPAHSNFKVPGGQEFTDMDDCKITALMKY